MRLYVIAGEASGDLHGAALLSALLDRKPQTEIRFWGGDEMASIAGTPRRHIRDLAFMGFVEVIKHLPTILGHFKFAKKDILDFKPDALVLIDYPGFNLRMAKWAQKNGIKVIYYISPQLWAWHQSRAEKIRTDVDRMLVILPFEKAFYKKYNIDVDYVGHPLAERLLKMSPNSDFRAKHGLDDRPIVALLPGSRDQEIASMLPIMLEAAVSDQYQFVIAGAPSKETDIYKPYLKNSLVSMVHGDTYQLLLHAHAAMVTSGTATLETALLNVPQIVCYKGSWLSYQIAKRVIKVDYISLVNLILNRPLVPELIQENLNKSNLIATLNDISNGPARSAILEGYAEIRDVLGDTKASATAAELIIKEME